MAYDKEEKKKKDGLLLDGDEDYKKANKKLEDDL